MYFYELFNDFIFQNLEASDKKHLNSHPILGIIVLILTCINVCITNLQLPYITLIILLIKIMCNNYLYKSSHYLFKLWNYFIKMCNVEFYLIKTFFYLLFSFFYFQPIIAIYYFIKTLQFIFQPIMTFFRCSPDDSRRKIFNWAHFGVGVSSHILAGK